MREIDLLAPVVKSFVEQGYRAYAEVKISSRWIDVLFHNGDTGETVAVELKMTNWKRAIRQAKVYTMVADYVYVAMPEQFVHRATQHEEWFSDHGIGVLSINGKAVELLRAQKSSLVVKSLKQDVIENLDPEMEVILDVDDNLTKTFHPCGRPQ